MSASLTGLLVAIVGVLGTLGGTVLTQTRADRTKRLELDHAARQRAEEIRHADQLRDIESAEAREQEAATARRACFGTLNTSARRYMTALVNHLHALRTGGGGSTAEALESCRAAFRDSYAEAQMIVPDSVLEVSSAASRHLNSLYGALKQAEASAGSNSAALNNIEAGLDGTWSSLRALRSAMRMELGVGR